MSETADWVIVGDELDQIRPTAFYAANLTRDQAEWVGAQMVASHGLRVFHIYPADSVVIDARAVVDGQERVRFHRTSDRGAGISTGCRVNEKAGNDDP